MRRNYHRKLLASIYHHAKKVGIIGILAYPKNKSKCKRGIIGILAYPKNKSKCKRGNR